MTNEGDRPKPAKACEPQVGRFGLRARLNLWAGRPRRLFYCLFRKGYIKANHARRRGECQRCGACCQLGSRCHHLFYDEHGLSACKVYGRRISPNCVMYPIDEQDLADRDVVLPDKPCGFWFDGSDGGRAKNREDAPKQA